MSTFFLIGKTVSFWKKTEREREKERAANSTSPHILAGDLSSIPGLGSSPGEGIGYPLQCSWGFPGGSDSKESASYVGDLDSIPWVGKNLLEESMATHSSILAWETPWTEEPGGLQSTGWKIVRHN